jgi:hypothetical protein
MAIVKPEWALASTSEVWQKVRDTFPTAGVGVSIDPLQTAMTIESPEISDADIESALAGWTPTTVDGREYNPPLPEGVRTHLQHLRDYLQADPAVLTEAQTVHVVKDLIRAVHYLNKRLEEE